ncbi:MAG TPA: putative peptidoglycan glycosyltransferase FtsW [Chlamydiales bacterium]|nr:putative peptidoglycan glycosyltransferase FtsW [Chlamydiales bacterium]
MNRSLLKQLSIAVTLLFAMGLVMIFNTSSAEAIDHFGIDHFAIFGKTTHSALLKQLLYGLCGTLFALVMYRFGYKQLIEKSPQIILFLSLLLLLVFVPGIGIKANGARRWIGLFGISLQPSEFLKYAALAYFTYQVVTLTEVPNFKQFLKMLVWLIPPLLLILVEPNNGTVAVIVMALVCLFFLTKIPLRFWALPIAISALVISSFALHMPYVTARLQVYLHPEMDLKGKGHQPHQAKIASGSGGLFGKGPGRSIQKLSYLPEAQNDYIAAIFAEEYGFVGVVALLALYGWLAALGLQIAFQASTVQGLYIAASFTFLMALQTFLNLGVVSGLLPSTGLNLPFFSQGGSSLIANLGALGIIMSVVKHDEAIER